MRKCDCMMGMDAIYHTKTCLMQQVDEWRTRAEKLWQLLDDISTLDDAAKSNDKAFRFHAFKVAELRGLYAQSPDGYTLDWLPIPPMGGE